MDWHGYRRAHNPEVAGKCPELGIESCPRYKSGAFLGLFCFKFSLVHAKLATGLLPLRLQALQENSEHITRYTLYFSYKRELSCIH